MVGIKSLIKIKPEILEEKVTLKEVIDTINSKDKPTQKEKNIIEGISQKQPKNTDKEQETQHILDINYNIIGIGEQFLTKEAVNGINELSKEVIDPEGRHWKNALDLMMSDGLLNILPKKDDSWVDFVRPFLRLTRIEKDFYKKNKK